MARAATTEDVVQSQSQNRVAANTRSSGRCIGRTRWAKLSVALAKKLRNGGIEEPERVAAVGLASRAAEKQMRMYRSMQGAEKRCTMESRLMSVTGAIRSVRSSSVPSANAERIVREIHEER